MSLDAINAERGLEGGQGIPGDDEPHLRYDATSPTADALDALVDRVRAAVGG